MNLNKWKIWYVSMNFYKNFKKLKNRIIDLEIIIISIILVSKHINLFLDLVDGFVFSMNSLGFREWFCYEHVLLYLSKKFHFSMCFVFLLLFYICVDWSVFLFVLVIIDCIFMFMIEAHDNNTPNAIIFNERNIFHLNQLFYIQLIS